MSFTSLNDMVNMKTEKKINIEDEREEKKLWENLCESIALFLTPPVTDFQPTALQTAEQQRAVELARIKVELTSTPLLPLAERGMEALLKDSDGAAIASALAAHSGELSALLRSKPADAEEKSVAELCGISDDQLTHLFTRAKGCDDAEERAGLFALMTILTPLRGDYWFCLALSLSECGDADLALKAAWAAVGLLPAQPEACLLACALLVDRSDDEVATPLLLRAKDLAAVHTLTTHWQGILDILETQLSYKMK